jgi:hypothetical protein
MGVVEDVRQTVQDFLAPELRALTARIKALEVKMDSKFETVAARMASAEERVALRHEILLAQMESVKGQLSLDYRISRLERQQPELPPRS